MEQQGDSPASLMIISRRCMHDLMSKGLILESPQVFTDEILHACIISMHAYLDSPNKMKDNRSPAIRVNAAITITPPTVR